MKPLVHWLLASSVAVDRSVVGDLFYYFFFLDSLRIFLLCLVFQRIITTCLCRSIGCFLFLISCAYSEFSGDTTIVFIYI